MAQKTVYYDSDAELEVYCNESIVTFQLSYDDYEPSMVIDLNSEDVGNLILDLQKLHAEMNGCS